MDYDDYDNKKPTVTDMVVGAFAEHSREAGVGAAVGGCLAALAVVGVGAYFGATHGGDLAINFVNWLRSLPQEAVVTATDIEQQLSQAGQQVQELGTFARGLIKTATGFVGAHIGGKVAGVAATPTAAIGGTIGMGVKKINECSEKNN